MISTNWGNRRVRSKDDPQAAENQERIERGQTELRESERRYRQIFETANEGIWRLDTEFRIVDFNSKIADMLGYPPEELTGLSLYDLTLEEDLPELEKSFQVSKEGKSAIFERRYKRKDAACADRRSVSPLVDKNWEFAGSSVAHDITSRNGLKRR